MNTNWIYHKVWKTIFITTYVVAICQVIDNFINEWGAYTMLFLAMSIALLDLITDPYEFQFRRRSTEKLAGQPTEKDQ